jgi:phosphatidylserine/phosphatidylglycerophosphate/cardiolipin synthase-like enzyme
MIRLSSTAEVTAAVARARDLDVFSYTLQRGPVLDAIEAAASRGTHVRVRLEGAPFGDRKDALARYNRRIAAKLASDGAEVRLANADGSNAPVHTKAIVADGHLFLDDRNWCPSDFIVADDDPRDARRAVDAIDGRAVSDGPEDPIAMHKRSALEREAGVLREVRRGGEAVVESESFGYGNPVYPALDGLARHGVAVRLLVCKREARGVHEASALARLQRDGVSVRLTNATQKVAVAGSRAWIGSANASPDFGKPDMIDWGMRTEDAAIVEAARARFEARWDRARPFTAKAKLP